MRHVGMEVWMGGRMDGWMYLACPVKSPACLDAAVHHKVSNKGGNVAAAQLLLVQLRPQPRHVCLRFTLFACLFRVVLLCLFACLLACLLPSYCFFV